MLETARKPYSIRLSDDDVALLPPGDNIGESVRKLITESAANSDRQTAMTQKIAALEAEIAAAREQPHSGGAAAQPCDGGVAPDAVAAVETILRHLRDLYQCQLRTEAVATATLYGVADSEATGEDMEAQLKTRFDAHMASVWPRFIAQNERGLRSLCAAAAAAHPTPAARLDAPHDPNPGAADDARSADGDGSGGGASGGN